MAEHIEINDTESTCASYGRTTLPKGHPPRGVIYPTSATEVQDAVKSAREKGWKLHPISRGRNWGYGDRLGSVENSLIVDLSKMNHIIEVNEELAYAVIEPGVTPGQLHAHLQSLGGTLWMDANGAGPDTSIVGNILERGFGHSLLGDRASSVCGMEVVLGNGDILHTGLGHFKGAKATYTYKHGAGPALDGLFFQSNYGIVTKLGLWLIPKPEAFGGFRCVADRNEDLSELVDKLAGLRRHGLLRSCVHILNPLRSLMKAIPYPWDDTEGKRPVSKELKVSWCKELGIGAWSASGALYGPEAVVQATMSVVTTSLKPFPTWPLDDFSIAKLVDQGHEILARSLSSSSELLKGNPSAEILRTAAWRSPGAHPTSLDPIENEAGLMWIVPTLPARGADAMQVEKTIREGLEAAGFDAPITFTLINDRTLTCTANVSFNRRDPRDTEAAIQVYQNLMKTLIADGYPPYRCGIGSYNLLHNGSTFWNTAQNLKQILDPDNILSPGHYVPDVPLS
jgi:4-cresol dehydrogenase (hydroxylating)